MNNYEKLRQLLCEEEEIRNDLLELRETTEEGYEVIIKDEQELELRHILWYVRLKERVFYDTSLTSILDKLDFSLPLSSQDEVCESIYNYLITL